MAKNQKLNNLCYLILGILLRETRSGYEIVKHLQTVRPVTTSQVYPTLARLEKLELIQTHMEVQDKRPNKNLHSVTTKGAETLANWIGTEPDLPFIRDDFQTMIYSSWIKTPQETIPIVERRIRFLEDAISTLQADLGQHMAIYPDARTNTQKWPFSKYALVSRRIHLYSQEIVWCHGMIHTLQNAVHAETGQGTAG